jgi:hypothetical protein
MNDDDITPRLALVRRRPQPRIYQQSRAGDERDRLGTITNSRPEPGRPFLRGENGRGAATTNAGEFCGKLPADAAAGSNWRN